MTDHMSDDLRNRVARAIAYSGDIREKREWSELLPETRSHYRKQADAALAEMGGVADYQTTVQQVVDALTGAYANADHVPLYPEDCKEGHRSGVRDCAVRLGVYEAFSAQVDAAIEPAPVSVREAAWVLLGAWRNSQTIDADEKAQDYADIHECDVDAGRILEPWLRAIAEGKE